MLSGTSASSPVHSVIRLRAYRANSCVPRRNVSRPQDARNSIAAGTASQPDGSRVPAQVNSSFQNGGRPLTPEEFEEHFGDLPSDGEG
jgi:hypothetical protein